MVVLDTHAWLWWISAPERLSDRAAAAIDASESVGVVSISCWEVAMLSRHGRISLDRDPRRWLRQALSQPGLVALPVGPKAAIEAALLDADQFPGDPADRLIYACASETGAPLVTRDARLREFDPRGTLW